MAQADTVVRVATVQAPAPKTGKTVTKYVVRADERPAIGDKLQVIWRDAVGSALHWHDGVVIDVRDNPNGTTDWRAEYVGWQGADKIKWHALATNDNDMHPWRRVKESAAARREREQGGQQAAAPAAAAAPQEAPAEAAGNGGGGDGVLDTRVPATLTGARPGLSRSAQPRARGASGRAWRTRMVGHPRTQPPAERRGSPLSRGTGARMGAAPSAHRRLRRLRACSRTACFHRHSVRRAWCAPAHRGGRYWRRHARA